MTGTYMLLALIIGVLWDFLPHPLLGWIALSILAFLYVDETK